MFVFLANANHTKIKLCKDCAHFDSKNDTCKAFRTVSFVSGEVTFPKAEMVRRTPDFCGVGAKYHIEDEEDDQFKKHVANILNNPNAMWK